MKKIACILFVVSLAAAGAASAFAQELKVSGEAKTSIFWEDSQTQGAVKQTRVRLYSMDDAGSNQGRFRLNMDYDTGKGFGFRSRIQWEDWKADTAARFVYAFGYGNFFEDQLTVSVGKLGGSPWGTGGPEMWKELEESGGGMRIEWKPNWVPEQYGKFNVGFVLNYFNSNMDQGLGDVDAAITLLDILSESVIGISYTHDYFHGRIAYRMDSKLDSIQGTADDKGYGKGQDELVYRLEERILKNYVPGLSVWALGYFIGMGAQDPAITYLQNWLFTEYNYENMFTAQVRLGMDFIPDRQIFNVKPSFYWHFFDKLVSAGASFWYGQDFGKKVHPGSPYFYMEVEPKVQLNFASSYIAFVYNYRQEYVTFNPATMAGKEPIKKVSRMNLRFCIYY